MNGGNLNTKGIKKTIQIPIEIGYRLTKIFSKKSEDARKNMELLGLMVNEPNIKIEEIHSIQVPTLVIAGKNDIIKGNHFIANKESKAFNQEVENFLVKTLKN